MNLQSSPQPLYLDNAASTSPAPDVIDAMLPWLLEFHANPHSEHFHGQRAHAAVEAARASIAELINADPDEIVFTSGATESNNLAIQGFLTPPSTPLHLMTTAIEHKSIGMVGRALQARGIQVDLAPVDRVGNVKLPELQRLLALPGVSGRKLLALGHANSELGTVEPVRAIAELAHASGWRVHVDAAQSAGKLPIDLDAAGIDSLSLSSHKLYGPAGIGALFIASDMRALLSPIMFGGGQEGGLRPGSLPVFLVVGFGTAAAMAQRSMLESKQRLEEVARAFRTALGQQNVDVELLGHPVERLPGHVSLRLVDVDAADLLQRVAPYLSASLGSACTAGQIGASHVLRGIGLDDQRAAQVIRICFGRLSTVADAHMAAAILAEGIARQSMI